MASQVEALAAPVEEDGKMKKLSIILVILLMLIGCSSKSGTEEAAIGSGRNFGVSSSSW